ncbi:MAG: hypothetical protein O6918_09735 [Deltaproteobacteria bacterium]|nr:hypothetical protein [Deltaproteobacteria bacterium]MCZ6563943.1 hypothetical protein [Deltaproteobacteria bacterium]MCZ6907277.1 hypothetical protein [Deltaproteobacteria bacterium]
MRRTQSRWGFQRGEAVALPFGRTWGFKPASYGHLGRTKEARDEWAEVLRINPDYSLEHRRRVLPFKNPDDFDKIMNGLRKAGVPE